METRDALCVLVPLGHHVEARGTRVQGRLENQGHV